MAERGVRVDHATIYRWVQRYAPEIEKRMRSPWHRPMSDSWRVEFGVVRAATYLPVEDVNEQTGRALT